MEQGRGKMVKGSAMLLVILMLIVGGVSGKSMVINQSTVPLTIERTTRNGITQSMVVGANATMELPFAFTASDITLRNPLTGGTFGPFTLRRNSVMLVQSSGLLSGIVSILLGTIIQGVLTALTTLIAAL